MLLLLQRKTIIKPLSLLTLSLSLPLLPHMLLLTPPPLLLLLLPVLLLRWLLLLLLTSRIKL